MTFFFLKMYYLEAQQPHSLFLVFQCLFIYSVMFSVGSFFFLPLPLPWSLLKKGNLSSVNIPSTQEFPLLPGGRGKAHTLPTSLTLPVL